MYKPPFRIHAMLPCDCGHCSTFWFFGDDEMTAHLMWPKTCIPGETIVYRCWHCGKEIEKKVEDVRCDIPTDFGVVSYSLDSHGLLSWICPVHGRRELKVGSMTENPEIYLNVETSMGLCCAESFAKRKKMEQGVENETEAKCIVCNRTMPARELVFFPHIKGDGCEADKLPICSSCWYDHEGFFPMEDECADCGQCDESVSPGDYDDPTCEGFLRMAVQNVEEDGEGGFAGFELVCTTSGTVLAKVESRYEDDDEDFDF